MGREVKLENDGGGLVNRLFDDGEKIKLETIVKMLWDKNLNRKKSVDDFGRLYILLGLCVFFMFLGLLGHLNVFLLNC